MIYKITIFIILFLILILLTLILICIFYYSYNSDYYLTENTNKNLIIHNNNNISIKQLFNQKNKLSVQSNTILALDGYISYLYWEYIDPISHNLIFQLKYISGLWSQNLSGKAILSINNHLIIAQYKTSYDNVKGKMILTLVDENNKQLTANGNVNIKLSFGSNKNISVNNVIDNPIFNNINNAPTMCRNF